MSVKDCIVKTEDGKGDLVLSGGLGDFNKRHLLDTFFCKIDNKKISIA